MRAVRHEVEQEAFKFLERHETKSMDECGSTFVSGVTFFVDMVAAVLYYLHVTREKYDQSFLKAGTADSAGNMMFLDSRQVMSTSTGRQ